MEKKLVVKVVADEGCFQVTVANYRQSKTPEVHQYFIGDLKDLDILEAGIFNLLSKLVD